jgi:hypothetical protein
MNLFDRYMALQFLKVLTAVSGVTLILVLIYSLTEFMVGFRVKDPQVGLRYSLYLLPLGFYIMFPFVAGLSVLIVLRRVFAKKMDLTFQSFGLSPLRFTLPIVLPVLAGSVAFLLLNESFLPGLFKKVWYMERIYKKKKEVGRIVEDLWFVKTVGGRRFFVHVESLDVATGRFADLFLLVTTSGGEVIGVVEGRRGVWRGSALLVEEGRTYSFRRDALGEGSEEFLLDTGIDLEEIGLFAEKIEHLRTSSLITLYTKGGLIGFDTNRYLAEVLFRGGMSFLSLVVVVPLLRHLLKRRDVRTGFLVLVLNLSLGWVAVIMPKVASAKMNLPPHYYLPLLAAVSAYVLKGAYDLSKGFRV